MNNLSTKSTDQPLVSIITPSYNQGQYIRATIESVLQQDYPHIEYIVVDGGSSDNTLSILKEYGERIHWISEPDQGQTDAINKGIHLSSGDIIAYLNSDDIYLPSVISLIVSEFKKYPDIEFLYGDHYAIDKDGTVISHEKTIPFDPNILLYDANFICQPASFYRRKLFEKIGIFDMDMFYLMDYEFFLRAAKQDIYFRLVRKYLAAIRFHSSCKTLTGDHALAHQRRVLKEKYANPKLFNPITMKVLGIIYRLKRYCLLIARAILIS